jgi:hypothetical protein
LQTKELRIANVDSGVANFSKEVNSFYLNVEDGIYFVNVSDLERHQTLAKKLVVPK